MITSMPGHIAGCPCMSCREFRDVQARGDALAGLGGMMLEKPKAEKPKDWFDRTASPWWALTLLLFPLTVYLNALWLSVAWGWFAVPLGVPAIGLAHAGGLTAVLAGLRHIATPKRDAKTNGAMVRLTAEAWTRVMFMWLAIAFWHWCMP